MSQAEQFDILIIGAGISGIGVAHHVQEQLPDAKFAILEAAGEIGGTWRIHTYPGIRSDSDLYTFGYRFKPWKGKPVAERDKILRYLNDVVDENNLRDKIRFDTGVTGANWSSEDGIWTITTRDGQTGEERVFQTKFLWMCQGYYDPSKGYTPDWPGFNEYKGQVVHPQTWPDDLDYTGKRVVVIGSGATAATLIPNMADRAGHITMVQRSPTYFWTGPNRNKLADFLRALRLPDKFVHRMVRWWKLKDDQLIHGMAKRKPDMVRQKLLDGVRAALPEGFDVDTHFSPSYRPWQQRLAYVPDADLFKAMSSGKVSVVTDSIERFTESGLITGSGEQVDADIIITATGFNLSVMGGLPFSIDGEPFDFSKAVSYRGVLLSDLPNMAHMFGYLRSSWTLRVDLVSDFVIRMLKHMRANGADVVVPTLRDNEQDMALQPWVSEDEFNPGYLKRLGHLLPKQGAHEPWQFVSDYYVESKTLPKARFDDGALVFHKSQD
ncbi:flavin-containing monooxygenase [Ruegeria halocynthiae]|uniref:flavin-containing monooxygenase n=1 Tax=Ruegeria halocynthiae TaxID=985054 RepID=UPI0005602581|nr:NAD(P)/FAD-dependent oxidoreductase [Ruegeria halocynthiae]